MDSQDLRNVYEFYNNLYEQQIGVPLKDASDRSAKEQLQKMIPKGEKVHTPKSALQNAAYEPEGDSIEEDYEPDMFDIILEYLVAEGYADTNQAAIAIMANMSEEWKQSIVEQDLTARQQYLIKKVDDMNAENPGSAHKYVKGKQGAGAALDRANRSALQMRGV